VPLLLNGKYESNQKDKEPALKRKPQYILSLDNLEETVCSKEENEETQRYNIHHAVMVHGRGKKIEQVMIKISSTWGE
jgi:hypothetical protein